MDNLIGWIVMAVTMCIAIDNSVKVNQLQERLDKLEASRTTIEQVESGIRNFFEETND